MLDEYRKLRTELSDAPIALHIDSRQAKRMSPHLEQKIHELDRTVRELSDIVLALPHRSPDLAPRILELQTALWHFMQTEREWDEGEDPVSTVPKFGTDDAKFF